MNITGKITGIKYKISLAETLEIINIRKFNINKCPAFCIVKDKANSFLKINWTVTNKLLFLNCLEKQMTMVLK